MDKVVLPVPERPKKIDVSLLVPEFALQCIGKIFLCTGSVKFKTEKIPFFISPVYPVPPIMIIFFEKLIIEKFSLSTPSFLGFALKSGAEITVHSMPNFSFISGLINILCEKISLQGYSQIVLMFNRLF